MPTHQTLERFIATVESNLHDRAIEDFYTENASMQENQNSPTVGRDKLLEGERKVMSLAKALHSRCVRPVLVHGDVVCIRWVFKIEWKDDTVTDLEEIAYQRWEGERIAQETFFYDPVQRVPLDKR
jgi:hypothetical protein